MRNKGQSEWEDSLLSANNYACVAFDNECRNYIGQGRMDGGRAGQEGGGEEPGFTEASKLTVDLSRGAPGSQREEGNGTILGIFKWDSLLVKFFSTFPKEILP